MRLVLGFALAATAAIALVACAETQEVTQSESPSATAPQASGSATPAANAAPSAGESATATPEALVSYASPSGEYSVNYPAAWTATELPSTTKVRDFVSAVEFYDSSGTLRASIFVFGNPDRLGLEDWIREHDFAFFEETIEEVTIDGHRALVRRLNFEGRESPLAYVEASGQVVSVKGLLGDDFDSIFNHLRLD